MDRTTDKGECEKRGRKWRDLQKELKELMRISREYWEGFRIEKKYETRVYIDKDGIRLFQSSTIEADPPAASAHPFLSILRILSARQVCPRRNNAFSIP